MGEAALQHQDVAAFRVQRTAGKASDIVKKGGKATASVAVGSTALVTDIDLRYDLRPGGFIRLDETHLLQLSEDAASPFEPALLTLAEPFAPLALGPGLGLAGGADLSSVKVESVALVELSAKQREKSVLQKQKEEQAERQRQAKTAAEMKRVERFFGYSMRWRELVPLLGAGPLNMRQQDFFKDVTPEFAVGAVFRHMCQSWFPASEGLDNAKFLKFLREVPGTLNEQVTVTDADLVFARSKSKGERKVTQKEFVDVLLADLAGLHFPWLAPSAAVGSFVADFVLPWKECQRLMWDEARRLAVVKEALRQCAARKLQSRLRGRHGQERYHMQRQATIKMQKQFASYRDRKQFLVTVATIRRAREAKRLEAAAKRHGKRKARLLGEVRLITGVANVVTASRHTKGSVLVECYNAATAELCRFTLTPDELRTIGEEGGRPQTAAAGGGASGGGASEADLYSRASLELVVQRLQYRKRLDKMVLVMGRKPKPNSGVKLLTQAAKVQRSDKRRSGALRIVSVTEARGEFAFAAYDPASATAQHVLLSRRNLHRWFEHDDDASRSDPPHLLRPENQSELLQHLVARLFLCSACAVGSHHAAHRRGEDVLMLECDMAEQRENNMAARLQGAWRARRARRVMAKLIARAFRKQWDVATHRWFYVRFDTGEVSWTKPRLLFSLDLPDPPDAWEEAVDEAGGTYYYHPLTGRTSWISEGDAATRIQRRFRKAQGIEFKLSFADMVAALTYQNQSERNYASHPSRLASIANYALLMHTRDHDHAKARALYGEALALAPNSPLLLFSFAVFLLADSAHPRRSTWDEAMRLLDKAAAIDPSRDKFKVASRSFFFWAVISQPNSAAAWLNFALVQQSVVGNFDLAEKYYRKALDLAPTDEAVIANYEDFAEQRLPGGRFSGGGPGQVARKRSAEVARDGEWVRLRDPKAKKEKFAEFWFNEVTQKTAWREPDWAAEWLQRRKRASLLADKDGWTMYFDPIARDWFFVQSASAQAQWTAPDYLEDFFATKR